MKCTVFVISFCLFYILPVELYTTQYDYIDLDVVLRNKRLYRKYFECLTNKGRCTPDGRELKESIPDALADACSKCTEKQKQGAEKVIRFLIENKPEDFTKLEQLYDPQGIYRKKYKDEAPKYGIKI